MLTAQRITAITLTLKDGQQAVLVQHGKPWNGLIEFRCLAPSHLHDRFVIATRNAEKNSFSAAFTSTFRLDENEAWTVVLASPTLYAELQQASNPTTEPSPC